MTALSAQDYGPVKVDEEEYVDDTKLEVYEDKNAVKDPVKPEKKDPVVKPEKTDPNTGRTKRPRPPRDTTTERKPMGQIQLPTSYKKDSGMMMYIIIGAGALVVIGIIVGVIIIKKKKPKRKERNVAVEEQLDDEDQALADIEASKPERPTGNSTVTTAEGIKTSYDVDEKFNEETRIDDRGRNPSGIIIDEDMYFAQRTGGSFVDEDLEGGEGPDVSDLG